jgi:hypothetical protein
LPQLPAGKSSKIEKNVAVCTKKDAKIIFAPMVDFGGNLGAALTKSKKMRKPKNSRTFFFNYYICEFTT